MELNLYSKTVSIHSTFSPLTSPDNTSFFCQILHWTFLLLLHHIYSALASSLWLWQGFLPKLSSNLHSTVFKNWTLTSLKYLLFTYLQHVINLFKLSHWFPIFWHRIQIPPSLPFTMTSGFLYMITLFLTTSATKIMNSLNFLVSHVHFHVLSNKSHMQATLMLLKLNWRL